MAMKVRYSAQRRWNQSPTASTRLEHRVAGERRRRPGAACPVAARRARRARADEPLVAGLERAADDAALDVGEHAVEVVAQLGSCEARRSTATASTARITKWSARSIAITRSTILSRSGLPRSGSSISSRAGGCVARPGRRRRQRQPAVAAQAAVPAQPVRPRGRRARPRPQLARRRCRSARARGRRRRAARSGTAAGTAARPRGSRGRGWARRCGLGAAADHVGAPCIPAMLACAAAAGRVAEPGRLPESR